MNIFRFDGHISEPNVKEHAPPLAEVSFETAVEVHITGDVYDRVASGDCNVSTCSARSSFALRLICRIQRRISRMQYAKIGDPE